MYQVKFTTAYKKAYKLMKKRGLDIYSLDEVSTSNKNSLST